MNFNTRYSRDSVAFDYSYPIKIINYDKVVDKSHFRPDAEGVRLQSSGNGSVTKPVFDKDLKQNPPSDLEVSLRSGKFDKAEVSQMIIQENAKAEMSSKEAAEKRALDKKQKIIDARQEYLDKATGFKGSDQNITE